MNRRIASFLAALAIVICASVQPATPVAADEEGVSALARIADAKGMTVGFAHFTQLPDGVFIQVFATQLTPGNHGIHLHAVGKCEGPEFTTAGGHFNPLNRQHGANNPEGAHAGDLANLTVGADGAAYAEFMTDQVTLGDGMSSLFDADGSAVVIHAMADDEMTDPTGNSGGRVACGVIVRE